MKKEEEMLQLINKLKERHNQSYKFFEGLLNELHDESKSTEAMPKLLSCYPITQYAGFTYEEENLLSQIIEANQPSTSANAKED
jgi:hypothetical protein